jgi:hypothetical protein
MKEKKMLNKVIENILGDDYSTNKKFSKLSPEIQKKFNLFNILSAQNFRSQSKIM